MLYGRLQTAHGASLLSTLVYKTRAYPKEGTTEYSYRVNATRVNTRTTRLKGGAVRVFMWFAFGALGVDKFV